MNSLQVKALIAGIFWGLWPLLMNRGGMNGNASSVLFALIALIFVAPFSWGTWGNMADVKWPLVIGAGVLGAIGLLFFNSMLAKAPKESVGALFVVMIVTQTAMPTIYDIFVNDGHASPSKIAGFVLAAASAVFLLKS